jgi:translation initiation factor 1 (eIF-1/SUI1)
MSKKKDKLEVSKSAALKHNPFGALTGASAPQQAPAAAVPAAPPTPEKQKSRGRLVQRRETKHRGGKAVVVIAGLRASAHLAESEIEKLAQELKREIGCGGAVQRAPNDTEIVIQGDQPARVAALLRARGFRVDGVTQ